MLNKIKNSEECKQSGEMQQSHMRSAYVRDLSDREEIKYDATRDFSAPFYYVEEKIKEIINKCKSEKVYPESDIERLKDEISESELLNKEEKWKLQIKLLTAKNSQNYKPLKQNQVNVRDVYKHNGEKALVSKRPNPRQLLPAKDEVQSKPEPRTEDSDKPKGTLKVDDYTQSRWYNGPKKEKTKKEKTKEEEERARQEAEDLVDRIAHPIGSKNR